MVLSKGVLMSESCLKLLSNRFVMVLVTIISLVLINLGYRLSGGAFMAVYLGLVIGVGLFDEYKNSVLFVREQNKALVGSPVELVGTSWWYYTAQENFCIHFKDCMELVIDVDGGGVKSCLRGRWHIKGQSLLLLADDLSSIIPFEKPKVDPSVIASLVSPEVLILRVSHSTQIILNKR
jgi:hypothetical protein